MWVGLVGLGAVSDFGSERGSVLRSLALGMSSFAELFSLLDRLGHILANLLSL